MTSIIVQYAGGRRVVRPNALEGELRKLYRRRIPATATDAQGTVVGKVKKLERPQFNEITRRWMRWTWWCTQIEQGQP
jgi:hypothetical protein